MPRTPSGLNILYLHSHDTGRYIQSYGYPVHTPNLQRFAERGVLFRNAFCVNPTCSPSRSALLTGTWPHVNGMIGLAHRGSRLHDYSRHLAQFCNRHGYITALSGVHHEIHNDQRQLLGYQQFLDDPAPAGMDFQEGIARNAVKFLERDHERPFFLSCGFMLTHRTGKSPQWHNDDASPAGDPRYTRPPAPLPDTPGTRRDFADFTVAAGRLDRLMGMVLDTLERRGLAGRTLVILTTDHGIAFPLMKCNLTDHGTGVMLMLRGPGGLGVDANAGAVVEPMTSHLDIFPTICDLAGLPAPECLHGRSLLPLVHGRIDTLHEALFMEVNYHAAYEPMRAVRSARYKYVRRFDPRPHPVLPNCDDSVSKDLLLQHGWANRPPAAEALFDLAFDPHEACNIAGNPAAAPALADLRARLERWMRDTNDPLLEGPVPPWPGMVVNPVEGLSPDEPTITA